MCSKPADKEEPIRNTDIRVKRNNELPVGEAVLAASVESKVEIINQTEESETNLRWINYNNQSI
jgi:hypothetical protein